MGVRGGWAWTKPPTPMLDNLLLWILYDLSHFPSLVWITVFKHFFPILVWFLLSHDAKNAASLHHEKAKECEPAEECGLQSVDCFVFAIIIFWYFLHKSQCDGWNYWQNYTRMQIWNFGPQVAVKVANPECCFQSSYVSVGESDKLIQ